MLYANVLDHVRATRSRLACVTSLVLLAACSADLAASDDAMAVVGEGEGVMQSLGVADAE